MEKHPSLAQVKYLELARGIFALDCPCLNLVELYGGSRKMDTSDTRPETSENDSLQQIRVVAIGVEIWGRGSGRKWYEAKIGQ